MNPETIKSKFIFIKKENFKILFQTIKLNVTYLLSSEWKADLY